ncbi:MAG: transporter, family, multidrug resistance protein [Chloroflexota bacterium]|nr:transporter, family, multidrug resistance protein [Chloroflexota bacterium]
MIVSFIETVGFGHYFAFLPILVRDLGVAGPQAATTVGLLSTTALLVGLPLVPFWGAWADRYSRKVIVVRSAVVEGVLFLLLSQVTEIWQVFILIPLAGLNLGNTGVMLAEITDRTPRRRLGFAMSLVGTAGPLGIALGPALGGAIADTNGVQLLFLIDAVLTGFATIVLIALYHERKDRPRTSLTVLQLVRRSLAAVIRTPVARAVFLASFLLLLGQRTVFPFLALWVEQINGPVLLATTVGVVAGAYGIAASIGSPLAGRLGDRVGYLPVFGGAVVIAAVSFVVVAFVTNIAAFAGAYAVYGICFATASSMLFVLLATRLPADVRSPILNLALAPLYLSGILGSLLSTQVLIWTDGDLRPLWLIGAVFSALCLLPLRAMRGAARAAVP